jgi:hypothetical protein
MFTKTEKNIDSKRNRKSISKNNSKNIQQPVNFKGFFDQVVENIYKTFGLKRREEEIHRIVTSLETGTKPQKLTTEDEAETEVVNLETQIETQNIFQSNQNPFNQSQISKQNGVRIKLLQNKKNTEFLNFLDDLTSAMVGHKIADIPPNKRVEIVTQCTDIFSNFVVEYVRHHYGPKHALRLKSARDFADHSIFEKFHELDQAFAEAFRAFVQILRGSTIFVK